MARDACFLWEMTGDSAFEKIAAGALYYVTGINFGVPAAMAADQFFSAGPLTCAGFIANLFGSILPWQEWGFRKKNADWASIVNGYTVVNADEAAVINGYKSQNDDYVYTNRDWQHGETFIRMDGMMLFAGSLYENLVNAF